MKVIVVIACLIAVVAADTCGPLQRLKVKRQWAESYGHGLERAELGHFIWAQLDFFLFFLLYNN